MAYPGNYIGIAVSQETHQRLSHLKNKYSEKNFDDVVNHLLDLEDTYNPPKEIMEFEYILKNHSKLFRIIFEDTVTIEYFNKKTLSFEKNIEAWFTGERISDEDLNEFIKFIIKDTNILLLYEMKTELLLNNIYIKRV